MPVFIDLPQRIQTKINQLLGSQLSIEIELNYPDSPEHGDLTTNVVLRSWPKISAVLPGDSETKNPFEFTQLLAQNLASDLPDWQFSVAKPGFLNIKLPQSIWQLELRDFFNHVTQPSKSIFELVPGSEQVLKEWRDQKVIVEFTDPNPFKEFHIGHLYSNIVGESLSRLFEEGGAQVTRVCYQGDVGMHVAMSLWGLRHKLSTEKKSLQELEQLPLNLRIKYLGQSYAIGSTAYKENSAATAEIKQINLLVYKLGQDFLQKTQNWTPQVDYSKLLSDSQVDYQEIQSLYETGRKWSLEYFESIYARLGTKFNDYFFESLVGELGAQIVYSGLEKGIFKRSQGAIIFPGSDFGLHDRVFINSFGLPTYEAKELGLAPEKFKRWQFDRSFIITGNEIDEYFKVLLCALEKIEPDLAKKTTHLSHGMVRLPTGKMSSRTGKIITGEWLLNEAQAQITPLIEKNHPDWSNEKKLQVADQIGLGAIKFALLSGALGKDTAFDFASSLSFSGFAGPYIQYTAARCSALLAKNPGEIDVKILSESWETAEIQLLQQIIIYPKTVLQTISKSLPHILVSYVFELSQAFNSLYAAYPILGSTPEHRQRLVLTQLTLQILSKVLYLLGISTPERM